MKSTLFIKWMWNGVSFAVNHAICSSSFGMLLNWRWFTMARCMVLCGKWLLEEYNSVVMFWSLVSKFARFMICVLNWGDLPFCSYLYFDSMATCTILPVIFLLWKCCTYKYVGKICFLLEIDALFFLNIQYAISLDALLILLLLLNFC